MRSLLVFLLVVPKTVAAGGEIPTWSPSAESFDARLHAVSQWLERAKLDARDFRSVEMLKHDHGKAGRPPAWVSRVDTGWNETWEGENYFFGVGSWAPDKGDLTGISVGRNVGTPKPLDRVLKPAEVVRWAEWMAAVR